MPFAAADSVTVTVSVWLAFVSAIATPENGAMVTRSVVAWPATVPLIVGGAARVIETSFFARTGEVECQLIAVRLAYDRGASDDGCGWWRSPRSTTTSPVPTTAKLRFRPSPVTETRSARIGSDSMCVTSSCVVPRLIANVPPWVGRNSSVRVIGVIAGDTLDDVRAAVDDVERHPSDIGRRGVRGDRRGDRVADGGVVDGRLLLRLSLAPRAPRASGTHSCRHRLAR